MTRRPVNFSHVPRRGVPLAKELRRMGLEVVRPHPPDDDKENEMSNEVKQVTEVAKDIVELGSRARGVGKRLRQDITDTHQALDVAEDVSKALQSAAAELRGALGITTNSPPDDEKTAGEGGEEKSA